MAKKPGATKRLPKPAAAKKGPSRPVSRLPKPPQAKALVEEPVANGMASPLRRDRGRKSRLARRGRRPADWRPR